MDNILLSAALAFLITFFAIPVIIQVAKDKKLFDEPDERKVHKTVIPTLGGLGIFAGFIIATLMGVPSTVTSELQYFAAAATVIFFLGIKDDILVLSASKKFIGQLIAAGIIIKFGGIQINNMHGFLGIYEIPHIASIVLSIFTIIVITNSFNLIDGVDGLAGSLGLLTTLVFGAYFYYAGQLTYSVMAFALAGSIIGFLLYNFSPAKIFMGDTGSLALGGILATLAIIVRKELLIPILCGIFLVENLSVLIQVSYFKYTKRRFGEGRRVFKMAPLHHHYQKLGYAEPKIVTRFWIVGILLAIVTIVTLKIR